MSNNKTPKVFQDTKICPVCGSDMKRDKTDNPHDVYEGRYTCCNQKCTVNAVFRN